MKSSAIACALGLVALGFSAESVAQGDGLRDGQPHRYQHEQRMERPAYRFDDVARNERFDRSQRYERNPRFERSQRFEGNLRFDRHDTRRDAWRHGGERRVIVHEQRRPFYYRGGQQVLVEQAYAEPAYSGVTLVIQTPPPPVAIAAPVIRQSEQLIAYAPPQPPAISVEAQEVRTVAPKAALHKPKPRKKVAVKSSQATVCLPPAKKE